jgi:hypothetical protein
MRLVTLASVLAFVATGPSRAEEPAANRTYWVYDGGWFAKSKDDSWYEMNELTFRKFGKPVKFKEVKRTKEFIELYDEDRKVGVRLYDETSEVQLADRPNPAWEKLYKGQWKTPIPAE